MNRVDVRQRVLRGVGASLLALSVSVATGVVGASAATSATDSAVTVSGTGDFSSLKVTVGKTKDLQNEVVPITWTGAAATQGNFGLDYLQIFQCWGDDPTGPAREQCQFGGLAGDNRGGAQVASRQVTYDITDPLETYRPRKSGDLRYVPFRSVTGKTTESGVSEFFDGTTTNEVPFAPTRSDGGGFVPFEMQTGQEAPGLGCGEARSDTATATIAGRSCWLVVVPRGDKEVDGSTRTPDSTHQLLSSPLSETNWRQRLVVPLLFAPLGQPCPIGRAERSVVGHENVVEAVSSWQPALCAKNGPLFSYSQVPDAVARRQILGDAAGLSLTSRPLSKRDVPAGRPLLYAPVALSGMTVAFNIESQSAYGAPAEVKARDGQRILSLDLSPRLVAKLLTQSYRLGAANPDRPGIEKNPLDLTRDPEFLRINPRFRQLSFLGIPDILVPPGLSDAGGLVWQWLTSDAEAKAFLAGSPDPDGMVINPAYKGTMQRDDFPKADTVCKTFLNGQPPLCTLDAHPYAADSHSAARAAARGDTLSRATYDSASVPATYKKSLPQPTGSRAILALTDAATAQRFGLQTASLRNAAGAFVAPTPAALQAGVAAMPTSSDADVLLSDPAAKSAAAYPLTSLTYAVASPVGLSAAARRDYVTFLRNASGPGQVPGTSVGRLPPGYSPLSVALRSKASAAATRLALAPPLDAPLTGAGAPPVTAPATAVTPAGGSPLLVNAAPAAPAPSPETLPQVLGVPAPVVRQQPSAAPVALVQAGRTADLEPGWGRYAVLLCLVLGGLAALSGSALRRMTSRPTRGAAT